MRRFIFYISTFLITLIFGCFIGIKNFSEPVKENQIIKKSANYTKFLVKEVDGQWKFVPVSEFPITKTNSISNAEIFESKTKEYQKPFCRDKRILPVWKLLLRDEYFRDRSDIGFEEPNCAKMFDILRFDLNSDGRKELILRAKISGLCGATGNCGFWIFEKRGRKYRKILSASDYWAANEMGEQIRKSKNKLPRSKLTGY